VACLDGANVALAALEGLGVVGLDVRSGGRPGLKALDLDGSQMVLDSSRLDWTGHATGGSGASRASTMGLPDAVRRARGLLERNGNSRKKHPYKTGKML
jgi:hypothetical protein